MAEVTHILSAIERGDSHAAERLLPLVYDELRRLAAQKLAQEKPGQTLQATALVHDAHLRLVGVDHAASLPRCYKDMRRLTAQKRAQEKPGQTLQATALVHEAYLRLVDVDQAPSWNS